VPDLGTALEEMARVLRPGGPAAIAVPSHAPGPFRVVTEGLARFGQARVFAPGELSGQMRARGWSGVAERSIGGIRLVDASAPA
jgi:arsenite methyltransferase